MNIHYKNYPTDYIDHLKSIGKRHKARCFWEYQDDVQCREVNSIGFYAKSWGVDEPMSKGTVHKWILEFRDQIQKFHDTHALINQQHYTSVKKQSERQVNGSRTNDTPKSPIIPMFEKTEETASERQVNKALNIYNNNNARGLYDGFYFIYRQFNRYAGNKMEALNTFISIDDVEHKRLSIAAILYLKDNSVDKKVGVKKFLDNKIYLNYLDLYLSVMIDGVWKDGIYDTHREVFSMDDIDYSLTAVVLADKFGRDEIRFIREVVA